MIHMQLLIYIVNIAVSFWFYKYMYVSNKNHFGLMFSFVLDMQLHIVFILSALGGQRSQFLCFIKLLKLNRASKLV